MKINATIFSKPQQDQLKRGIGAELDKVAAKIDSMLNYRGDWASGNEYHENDVVTWGTDGHLYEVIKAHTSSSTINPSNTEYYKAMTATRAKHTQYGDTPGNRKEFYDKIMEDTHKLFIIALKFTPFQQMAMTVVASPIVSGEYIVIAFERVYNSQGTYYAEHYAISVDKNGGINYFKDGTVVNGIINELTLYEY